MLHINKILVPRDFSAGSDDALRYALDLAVRTSAEVHLLYAEVLFEPFADVSDSVSPVEKIRERLKQSTEPYEGVMYDPGSLRIEHVVVRGIAAAPAILTYASDHDMDLIVMGTHGRRGIRRMAMGSVAEEVVRMAPCPVLTVHLPQHHEEEATKSNVVPQVQSLLVPIDFSSHARLALRYAKELAALFDARLELLHVIEEVLHPVVYGPAVQSIYEVHPDIEKHTLQHLSDLYDEVEGPQVPYRLKVMPGHASYDIAAYADERNIDLVVMPTHGRTGLEHFFLGSVAEKVVRRAHRPVFTVKGFGKNLIREAVEAEEAVT